MASGRLFDVPPEPEDSSASDDSFRFSFGVSSVGHSSISISSLGSYESDATEEGMIPIYDQLEISALENDANMLFRASSELPTKQFHEAKLKIIAEDMSIVKNSGLQNMIKLLDSRCDLLHSMANDMISPGEFLMMKMQDRPPRYEDIGKDRKVPFDIHPDEPPPLYASIFYPHPALFKHDSPRRPTSDEMEIDMAQPNYFMLDIIHEELTSEDEAIDLTHDEIFPSEPICENEEFPLIQNNSV